VDIRYAGILKFVKHFSTCLFYLQSSGYIDWLFGDCFLTYN
jgi:hypothetical protein